MTDMAEEEVYGSGSRAVVELGVQVSDWSVGIERQVMLAELAPPKEHFLVCRNFDPSSLPPSFDSKSLSHSVQSLSLDSFSAGEKTKNVDEERERRWQVIKGYTIGDLDCER